MSLKGGRFQSRKDIRQNATGVKTIPKDSFQKSFRPWRRNAGLSYGQCTDNSPGGGGSRMTSCNNDGCLLLRARKVRIGLLRIGRRFVHHGLIQLKKRGDRTIWLGSTSILRGNTLEGGQGPQASLPHPPPTREDLRLDKDLECLPPHTPCHEGTIHLLTPMPSPGFNPRLHRHSSQRH
ncbi:hypothetical protein TNCV_575591 [Trichonephila clavipes]|nr:hypothetical protein TNCV_575591 [Trichonephila clavipes]